MFKLKANFELDGRMFVVSSEGSSVHEMVENAYLEETDDDGEKLNGGRLERFHQDIQEAAWDALESTLDDALEGGYSRGYK